MELAKQHNLRGVQPEAVSFMQRAVRAVTNRLLVAATVSQDDGSLIADGAERVVRAESVADAIRQPVPAPWMAPPCQRAGYTLNEFSKFAA